MRRPSTDAHRTGHAPLCRPESGGRPAGRAGCRTQGSGGRFMRRAAGVPLRGLPSSGLPWE